MDEIDAALDFKNVSIVANYIKVIWLVISWLKSVLFIFISRNLIYQSY